MDARVPTYLVILQHRLLNTTCEGHRSWVDGASPLQVYSFIDEEEEVALVSSLELNVAEHTEKSWCARLWMQRVRWAGDWMDGSIRMKGGHSRPVSDRYLRPMRAFPWTGPSPSGERASIHPRRCRRWPRGRVVLRSIVARKWESDEGGGLS